MIAKGLEGNGSLTSLNLRGNKMGPEGAKEIAKLLSVTGSLTVLKLGYNSIGDASRPTAR